MHVFETGEFFLGAKQNPVFKFGDVLHVVSVFLHKGIEFLTDLHLSDVHLLEPFLKDFYCVNHS